MNNDVKKVKIVKKEPMPCSEVGGEIVYIDKKLPGILIIKIIDKPGGTGLIFLTKTTIFKFYNSATEEVSLLEIKDFREGDFVLVFSNKQGIVEWDKYKHWIAAKVTKVNNSIQFLSI